MTFDDRAHRAAQGVRRAVEVMEMSSTKTPQRLTRFDQYRERTSRNRRIAAIVVGIGVPLLLVIGAVRVLGTGTDGTPATSVSPSVSSPTPTADDRTRSRRRSRTRCPRGP